MISAIKKFTDTCKKSFFAGRRPNRAELSRRSMVLQAHLMRSLHRQCTTTSLIFRKLCTAWSQPRGVGSVIPLPNLPELRKSGDDGRSMRALVRAPDLALRSHALGTDESPDLVLLSGEKGRGKSTSLRAAVSAARQAGAVVLYIPKASAWTQGGGFFASARGEEEGGPKDDDKPIRWYDRPFQTSDALQSLLDAHAPQLESVPCDSPGWDNAREAAEEGIRLVKSIDDDWRKNPRRAGFAFTAVIESLASHEDTRFVVAIDEYETLAGLSILGNERGRYVHSDGVAPVGRHFGRRSIEKFAESIRNGVVLLTQAGNANGRRVRPSRVLETEDFKITDEMRKDPNGVLWLKHLWESNGEAVIHYDDFGVKEMQKLLDLQNLGAMEYWHKNRLLVLAGGRGDILRKLAAGV